MKRKTSSIVNFIGVLCTHQGTCIYICVCVYVCMYTVMYICCVYTCMLCTYITVYTHIYIMHSSVQMLSRVSLQPMDCSTPGLSVHHQLLELGQTHVHHIGDAIQPSHPLSSPSPPAFNLSQHQGVFQ